MTTDATGVTATHAYPTFGSRPVALRVTDNNTPPKTDTVTVVVAVNQGNRAPVAEADGPYWIDVGQDLHLDGTGSSDPDAGCGDSLVKYEWDLNADGSYEFTGAAPTVPWSALSGLPQPGLPIPVRLRVTDTFGVTDTDDTELRIYVNAPVAAFTATPNPCACAQTVSFDAGGLVARPAGSADRQLRVGLRLPVGRVHTDATGRHRHSRAIPPSAAARWRCG